MPDTNGNDTEMTPDNFDKNDLQESIDETNADEARSPKADKKTANPKAHADIEELERRANELATRLASVGFSYSAGAKSVLDEVLAEEPVDLTDRESDQLDAETNNDLTREIDPAPVAALASIHDDDRFMEQNDSSNFFETEAAEKVSEREQHIRDWEDDAHSELSEKAPTSTDHAHLEPDSVLSECAENCAGERQEIGGLAAVEDKEIGLSKGREEITILETAPLHNDASDIVEIDTAPEGGEDPVSTEDDVSARGAEHFASENEHEITTEMELIAASLGKTRDRNNDAQNDLESIENRIEALTSNMGSNAFDVVENGGAGASGWVDVARNNEPEHQEEEASGMIQTRVEALEKQLVEVLDKITVTEDQISQNLIEATQVETSRAVQEAFGSADFSERIKSELEISNEDRRRHEVRMSDSLDALHDAIRDVSDRLKVLETQVPAKAVVSPEQTHSSVGGIASSVLGTQISREDQGSPDTESELLTDPMVKIVEEDELSRNQGLDPVEDLGEEIKSIQEDSDNDQTVSVEPEQVEQTTADEFPVWLEDATQEIGGAEELQPETPDVFSSEIVTQEEPVTDHLGAVNSPSFVDEDPEANSDQDQDEELEQHLGQEINVATPVEQAVDVEKHKADPEQEFVMPASEEELREQEHIGGVAGPTIKGGGDSQGFLHAARAAALAANERVRDESAEEQVSEKSKKKVLSDISSDFVQSAKKHEIDMEEPLSRPGNSRKAHKSLFSQKAKGPNLLLVVTALVLFGTSSLLLYGLNMGKKITGSTSRLEAVEKKTNPGSLMTSDGSGNAEKKPAAKSMSKADPFEKKKPLDQNGTKSNSKTEPKKDQRSGLTEEKIIVVTIPSIASGPDGPTDYDKMVSARLSDAMPQPSDGDITAALPDQMAKDKAGSLFDEYIGFSNEEPSNSLAIPSKNIGSAEADGETNSPGTQYDLAMRYARGEGVSKSYALSFEWYKKSANAGYAPAIYRLATMYERGKGVAKDFQKAKKLYREAADKGNVKAMHNLAVLYTSGSLGQADFKNAVIWYEKASNYGVADSQFNLAIIYQNGMGVSQDREKAYMWYGIAAKSGDTEAASLKAELSGEIKKADQKKLDIEIELWTPKKSDPVSNDTGERGRI